MKGISHSKTCDVISMKKAKELAKSMGISFTEIVFGIVSKTLK